MREHITIIVWLLLISFVSCNTKSPGCNDTQANNIDPSATENDGSCIYDPVWVDPVKSMDLDGRVVETSGLIQWDGYLWTFNDNLDTTLYGLDNSSGSIVREYLLEGVVNTDWEEIDQDAVYIYIGDIGNNGSGNRSDLHILRIDKGSLISGDPSIDTIWFSYSDQQDLSISSPNQTEFDCEAFVVFSDGIYLFTKQWISGKTTLYSLSKTPGSHVARKISSYQVDGLVTGATGLESERLVVLCGYSLLVQPFLILLYEYQGNDFFTGNRRMIKLSIPFHQVEGITTSDGLYYYLSNEYFNHPASESIRQKMHKIDLSAYLKDYLNQ